MTKETTVLFVNGAGACLSAIYMIIYYFYSTQKVKIDF